MRKFLHLSSTFEVEIVDSVDFYWPYITNVFSATTKREYFDTFKSSFDRSSQYFEIEGEKTH